MATLGRGYLLWMGERGPTLDGGEEYLPWIGKGYIPWMNEGYLLWMGGGDTYLG